MAFIDAKKTIQSMIGKSVPNGIIINGVLGYVDAAMDSFPKDEIKKILARTWLEPVLDEAKQILVETVKDSLKTDKDMAKPLGQRHNPDRREKICADIVDILVKLDEKKMMPTILMTSNEFKGSPELKNPQDDCGSLSARIRVLERCVITLAEKITEETKIIKDDIKDMKPRFTDLFRGKQDQRRAEQIPNPVNIVKSSGAALRDTLLENSRKRSRAENGDHIDTGIEMLEEVFHENDFQTQNYSGFKRNNREPRRDRVNEDMPQKRPGEWKRKMSVVNGKGAVESGSEQNVIFSAPVDLFVFNVNNAVNEETMTGYMNDNRGLELLECSQVSHADARSKSFRVKIAAKDYDLAMKDETWPYRVRVRLYRHFKQKQEGQFGIELGNTRNIRK